MKRSVYGVIAMAIVCIMTVISCNSCKSSYQVFHKDYSDTDQEMLAAMALFSDSVLNAAGTETQTLVEKKMAKFKQKDDIEDQVSYFYLRTITAAQTKEEIEYVAARFSGLIANNPTFNDNERFLLKNLFTLTANHSEYLLEKNTK